MFQLADYIADIEMLCQTHGVKHLFVFGSAITEDFNPASDIDLLVDFLPTNLVDYADNYFSLKFSLENILHRKVDLLEEKALTNPYFVQSILNQKELLYGS